MNVSSFKIKIHDFFTNELKEKINNHNSAVDDINNAYIEASKEIDKIATNPQKNVYVEFMDLINKQTNCFVDLIAITNRQMEVFQPEINKESKAEHERLKAEIVKCENGIVEKYKELFGENGEEYIKICRESSLTNLGTPFRYQQFQKFPCWNELQKQKHDIVLGYNKPRLEWNINILKSAFQANIGLNGKVKTINFVGIDNGIPYKLMDKIELY
jgi:hypothetical protein